MVAATVFMDPFCPWCWAAQPQLRRLQVEFGEGVAITFVIAGLRQRIDDLAFEAIEASAASGMPIDARVFLRDPPSSSQPAGLAIHAVAEQARGTHVAAYVRRLQEAVMLERRRMDSAPALLDAAREVGGLHLDALRVGFGSSAIVESYAADRERAAGLPLPSVRFGDGPAIEGYVAWEAWREAALAAGARPAGEGPLAIEGALRRFGPMATPEVALVCDLAGPRAPAALWQAALEWRVRPRRVAGGELWEAA